MRFPSKLADAALFLIAWSLLDFAWRGTYYLANDLIEINCQFQNYCENNFIQQKHLKENKTDHLMTISISVSSCTSADAMSSAKSEASSSEVAMVLSRIAVLGNVSP